MLWYAGICTGRESSSWLPNSTESLVQGQPLAETKQIHRVEELPSHAKPCTSPHVDQNICLSERSNDKKIEKFQKIEVQQRKTVYN